MHIKSLSKHRVPKGSDRRSGRRAPRSLAIAVLASSALLGGGALAGSATAAVRPAVNRCTTRGANPCIVYKM
jgi:hypothetical protein